MAGKNLWDGIEKSRNLYVQLELEINAGISEVVPSVEPLPFILPSRCLFRVSDGALVAKARQFQSKGSWQLSFYYVDMLFSSLRHTVPIAG